MRVAILQNTKDKEVANKIISALGDFSQGVDPHSLEPFLNQEGAISALGKIDHPESSRILLDYARKTRSLPDMSIKKEADLALALAKQNQFEDPSALPLLKKAEEDGNLVVRAAVSWSLEKFQEN